MSFLHLNCCDCASPDLQECNHEYARDEIFMTISLEVKRRGTLQCSLEQHIRGEPLESYMVSYGVRCIMSRSF